MIDIRSGIGYDMHVFTAGDHVMIGGVRVPHDHGVLAHSDGDVALHALTDAILGSLALGDIGDHFPPSDPKWRGAASAQFLRHAVEMVDQAGYRIGNIDLTIIAEAPKIGPHRHAIADEIARLCNTDAARVSVKATTNEGVGFVGRREGLAALATVLLIKE